MDNLNVSDLQASLIIIGGIIIAGVVIFNWVLQLRYRREVQEAKQSFEHKHEDVLLDESQQPQENSRIEPQFNKKFMQEIQESTDQTNTISEDEHKEPEIEQKQELDKELDKELDSEQETVNSIVDEDSNIINYVVIIKATELIPADTKLVESLHHKFDFEKTVNWYGKHKDTDPWEEITLECHDDENKGYMQLKGCLQLVDRSGPVTELSLSKFRDWTQEIATQFKAEADCPDIMAVHEQAVLLDKFCMDVDVMIGINIISRDKGAFVGKKIHALAEASGFKLDEKGGFKYRDDHNVELFTLTNYESTPFLHNNMNSLTTQGITFLIDVPRVAKGESVFEQMTHVAKIFSNTLGGIMVDDNHVPLSDNGIAKSIQQLNEIQANMKANMLPAGSNSALKLFS